MPRDNAEEKGGLLKNKHYYLLGGIGFSGLGNKEIQKKQGGLMQNRSFLVGIALLIGVASLGLAGCQGKVTGGGWLLSASGQAGDKANFGFNGTQCDPEGELSGSFNYHDKNAPGFTGGVKVHSTVTAASLCTEFDPTGVCEEICFGLEGFNPGTTYILVFEYRSTNPQVPGDGFGIVCVNDSGEGKAADPDRLAIVLEGPYEGYFNSGQTQGNIQSHACPGQ